mgnify:CR=1 FL=1
MAGNLTLQNINRLKYGKADNAKSNKVDECAVNVPNDCITCKRKVQYPKTLQCMVCCSH